MALNFKPQVAGLVSEPCLTRGLRHGLGLRRPDLAVHLSGDIKRGWHIRDSDSLPEVRAKAIWQVEYCLGRLVDPNTWEWEIARVAYNTILDAPLNELWLLKRLETALPRLRPKRTRRTAERWLEELDDDLTRLLTGDLPPPVLEPASTTSGGSVLRAVIPTVHGLAWESAIDAFLATDVHVPVGAAGKVVAGTTPSRGRWVCAFTRRSGLLEFQQVTQPTWAGDERIVLGATLVKKVHKADYYTGLMIDPPARDNVTSKRTLGISALQLAVIASNIA